MTAARQMPESDYQRLKALFRRLVKMAGGLQEAAQVTRVEKSQLSDYCNPEKAAFAPADVILDLEAEVGQPVVSREIVRLVGVTEAPREQPTAGSLHGNGDGLLIALGKEREAFRQAMQDGHLDDAELARLEKHWSDILAVAVHGHDEICRLRQARRETAKIDAETDAGDDMRDRRVPRQPPRQVAE